MSYDPNQGNEPGYNPPPQGENPGGYPPPSSPYTGYGTPPPSSPYTGYGTPPPSQEGYPGGYPPPQQGGYPGGYPPPQQGGYPSQPQGGYSPYGPGGYNEPPAQPLPLGEAIRQLPSQYLRVTTKPGANTFAMEKGKAAWNIVWVQLLALGVLSAILIALYTGVALPTLMSTFSSNSSIPSSSLNSIKTLYASAAIPVGIGSLVSTIVGFFVGVGIMFLIAKAFGGQGTFLQHGYSYLLFTVPLTILSYLVALVPFVGSLASLAIWVYSIVLQVYMTMAVHRLSGGRATLAVLILPIIAIVLACVGFFVLISVIARSIPQQ